MRTPRFVNNSAGLPFLPAPSIGNHDGEMGAAVIEAGKKPAWLTPKVVSWGALLGAQAVTGGLNILVNKFIPAPYAKAASPVINITNDILSSPGRNAQESVTNAIDIRIRNLAAGPAEQGVLAAFSRTIYPKMADELAAAYQERGKYDAWAVGKLAEFTTYLASVESVAKQAKVRVANGDVEGAARLMGAAMYYDWSNWGEYTPIGSPRMYEYLFLVIAPVWSRIAPDIRAQLKTATHEEALRLNGGKDEGLGEFCDAIMAGILENQKPAVLIAPWVNDSSAVGNIVGSKHADPVQWVQQVLERHFDDEVAAYGWKQGLKTARARRAVVKAVVKEVTAFETAKGRPVNPDELWRMTLHAFNKETGAKLETRATIISAGAYLAIGVGAAVGSAQVIKATPAWAKSGVNSVVYRLFNYASSIVGSFAIGKLSALGNAIGYSGGEKKSLGKALERELRNTELRVKTRDGRENGIHGYFNNLGRQLTQQANDLAAIIRDGDLEDAATALAGICLASHTVHFEFWPYLEATITLFKRLGPNFDGMTATQRDDIIQMACARLTADGTTPEQLETYHRPFMTGLLSSNVKLKA